MIPYRDINPTRRTPVLIWLLLALNVVAFVYESAAIASGHRRFLLEWGFVPARVWADPAGALVTVLTSMFLHGGLMHLASNMLFLHVFGDNIEDRLGRGRFLLFYLLSGALAAVAQMAIDPASTVPMVGASGAIAGVLGAYLRSFPGARVRVVIPPLFFFPFELPAWFVIGEWFLLQLWQGFSSLAQVSSAGVAFFAHIGGFLAGFWLAPRLAPPRPAPRRVVVSFR